MLLAWPLAPFAVAATYRVDDSLSQPVEAVGALQWRSIGPGVGAVAHEAQTQVQVVWRLETRPWAGRSARIFMVLPPLPGIPLNVEWTTQAGRLLSGRLQPGDRVLVFAGTVPIGLLEDRATVNVRADGRYVANATRLVFHFEIDVD